MLAIFTVSSRCLFSPGCCGLGCEFAWFKIFNPPSTTHASATQVISGARGSRFCWPRVAGLGGEGAKTKAVTKAGPPDSDGATTCCSARRGRAESPADPGSSTPGSRRRSIGSRPCSERTRTVCRPFSETGTLGLKRPTSSMAIGWSTSIFPLRKHLWSDV